jgi:hypothetical protein
MSEAQAVLPDSDALARPGMPLQRKLCRICWVPLTGRQKLWCSDAHRFVAWDRANPRAGKVRQASLPGESRVERAFAAWIDTPAGRYVEAEVVRLALERVAWGRTRGEINLLCALVRDKSYGLAKDDEGYAVNNSFRSLLARKAMDEHEELRGFFRLKPLRGIR